MCKAVQDISAYVDVAGGYFVQKKFDNPSALTLTLTTGMVQ